MKVYKVTEHDLIPKLDIELNFVLRNPESKRDSIGYDPDKKEVGVYVFSSKHEIEGLRNITPNKKPYMHSGKVSLEYLTELSKKDDVVEIRSHKKSYPNI